MSVIEIERSRQKWTDRSSNFKNLDQGVGGPIDLTNFCINVKSHLRMHQNTHHFLVKMQLD